jgi:hypothetical protein
MLFPLFGEGHPSPYRCEPPVWMMADQARLTNSGLLASIAFYDDANGVRCAAVFSTREKTSAITELPDPVADFSGCFPLKPDTVHLLATVLRHLQGQGVKYVGFDPDPVRVQPFYPVEVVITDLESRRRV